MCHNKDAPVPDLSDFAVLKELTKEDEGATFGSLTRVSHIHLFGIGFIFMFVGLIFSFNETSTAKYKSIAIGMPYLFLLVDIISWWLTKLNPMFAWLVIIAGAGMGISFAFMWLISILEMWFFERAFLNPQGERYQQWSVYLEGKFQDIGGEEVIKLFWSYTLRSADFIWKWCANDGVTLIKSWYAKIRAK
jgi:hypothetical protein